MDLSQLATALLPADQVKISQQDLADAYASFKCFLNQQKTLGFYFDRNNRINTANTASLVKRMINEFNFSGKIELIYYDDNEVKEQLASYLPYFKEESVYSHHVLKTPTQVIDLKAELLFNGGSEQSDPFWQALPKTVNGVVSIRPFLDGNDFSFIKLRQEKDLITYFTDTLALDQLFSERPFYSELEGITKLPEKEQEYWKKYWKNQAGITLAEELLELSDVQLFTIDGLKTQHSANDRGINVILQLTLASLKQLKQSSKTRIMLFTDYDSQTDPHFTVLKSLCDRNKSADMLLKEWCQLFPLANEADLRVGLLNPLLELRAELKDDLEKIAFCSSKELKTLKKGWLYLCPVGELPYDYLAQLYKKSDYLFFESCDYTNLAINLGKPYLQKAIDVASDNYPALSDPITALEMNELSELFAYPITVYTAGVNKQLAQEIAQIVKWLQNPNKNYFLQLQKEAQRYLKTSSSKIPADKLTTALAVFEALREMSQAEDSPEQAANSFEAFFKNLKTECNKSKRLAVATLLKESGQENLAAYLASFTGRAEGWIELQEEKQIQLDRLEGATEGSGEICGVSILAGAAANFSGTVDLSFQEQAAGKGWRLSLSGHSQKSGQLSGIPWLTLTEARFSVLVPESGGVLSGSVGGTFGKTADFAGIDVVVELNQQTGTSRLLAYAREPITTLKLFGAIAGGLDFEQLLPEKIQSIIRLGLVNMEFYYDWDSQKISSMTFTFANQANEPWILWGNKEAPKLSAYPSVGVTVLNPADLSRRQVKIAMSSFVDLGSPNELLNVGRLWLSTIFPPFKGELRLASEKIDLKKFIRLFDDAVQLDGFNGNPAITDLTMLADFDKNNYQLTSAVDLDWELTKDFKIRELSFQLTRAGDKTVLGFAGTMEIVSNLMVAVAIYLDNQHIKLRAELAVNQELSMKELVKRYVPEKALNEQTLNEQAIVEKNDNIGYLIFEIDKTTTPAETDILIEAGVSDWKIKLGKFEETLTAKGKITRNAKKVAASLSAEIKLLGAKMTLVLDYGADTQFQLNWGNFTGKISGEQAVIKLENFSIGEMIETFIGWLYSASFKLDAPWDCLNRLKTDLALTYNFKSEIFEVTLGKEQLADNAVNSRLPFGEVQGISLTYNPKAVDQKIKVELQIKFDWQKEAESMVWDAAEPGSAPSPAGSGNDYFKLDYLTFGQKMQFFDKTQPNDVGEALSQLKNSLTPEKVPSYAENVGMLIASEFKFLKESGDDYFLRAQFVFYDPSLYGLKIQLAGKTAKFFAGLSFEILYAKLSETLGVFKSKLVLPEKFRNFDLGAFSVSMPDFYIEVYTNGDFYLDIGFPKNGDFSRSFTLSGIVPPGLPLTGSAGIYFGKLSAESAKHRNTHLPVTDKGVFNPVITFGLGLRFGLGKSIHYGPLSGGFALVVQTILEGVIAKWQPYQADGRQKESWYYYLDGTAGIVGTIFGKIDLSIINISVNLELSFSAKFIYEIGCKIPLTIEAAISAAASLSINLGLFKVKISFKFKVKVKESFTIGQGKAMPWRAKDQLTETLYNYPAADILPALSVLVETNAPKQPLNIWLGLTPTIASDEYEPKKTVGIANLMMTMDQASFVRLLDKLIEVTCIAAAQVKNVELAELNYQEVDTILAEIETTLENSPFSSADLEEFLSENFELVIKNDQTNQNELTGEPLDVVYFPLPPSTTLAFSDGELSYRISEYNKLSEHALNEFKVLFEKTAVVVAEEKEQDFTQTNTELAMGDFVFADWFMLALRQSMREMRRHLREQLEQKTKQPFETASIAENIGGMLSRFSLHGMRVPASEGLILPKVRGLWVNERAGNFYLPKEAGIFALTGQSFLLSQNNPCSVRVSFDKKLISDQRMLELRISEEEQVNIAKAIKQFADDEKPTINVNVMSSEASFVPERITFKQPVTKAPFFIYEMPQSLLAYYQQKSAYYPEFTFYFAEDVDEKAPLEKISGHTLIEFSVTPTEKDDVYVIGQASKQVTELLSRIIQSPSMIAGIHQVKEGRLHDNFVGIGQINLSTETRPAKDQVADKKAELKKQLTLLWKAFVTNNQGYVLTLAEKDSQEDDEQTQEEVKLTFSISYTPNDLSQQSQWTLINAVGLEEEGVLVAKGCESLTGYAYQNNQTLEDILQMVVYSDYGRIAQKNLEIKVNPAVNWVYPVGEAGKKITFKEITPNKGMSLLGLAELLGISAATLLYYNREQKGLFLTKKLLLPLQAGSRIGGKVENTDSLINEQYLIEREQLDQDSVANDFTLATVKNNYSLLRYRKGSELNSSVPYSDKESKYELIVPIDKLYGGNYQVQGLGIPVTFQWLDYYGNQLIPEFQITRAIGYQDPILDILKWPGISPTWCFGTGNNEVVVTFKFDPIIFEDDLELVKRSAVKKQYLQIQKQLADPNFSVSLECSMYNKSSKDDQIKTELLQLVAEVLAFCEGVVSPHVIESKHTWRFASTERKNEKVLQLASVLIFSRAGFVAQGYEDVAGILQAEVQLAQITDSVAFAEVFEQKYSEYIVLKGGNSEFDLIAFRQAEMKVAIHEEKCNIYLPKPVSNVLLDRDQVPIKVYEQEGFKNRRINFRSVDLNQWLRQALEFCDQLLTANTISAAQKRSYDLQPLLDTKAAIAKALSQFLVPAFNEQTVKASEQTKAQFEQRLLGALANFYDTKAVIALPASVTGLPDSKTALYGNVELLSTDENEQKLALNFNSPKLINGSEQELIVVINGSEFVTDERGAVLPFANLRMKYTVTHLETDRTELIDGFKISSWYGKLLTTIYDRNFQTLVPFPLLTFPELPKLVKQESLINDQAKGHDCSWKYSYTYSRNHHYPQQVSHCKVRYNVKTGEQNDYRVEGLFAALASIMQSRKQLLIDLEQAADSSDNATIFRTLNASIELLGQLASALNEHSAESDFKEGLVDKDSLDFEIVEGFNEASDQRFWLKLQTVEPEHAELIADIEPVIEDYKAKKVEDQWYFEHRNSGHYLSGAEGQAYQLRKIILPEKSLLKYQSANTEMFVEQNQKLGKEMNEDFIFTTGNTTFDSPYYVSHTIDSEDIGERYEGRTDITVILTNYFKELCQNEKVQLQVKALLKSEVYPNLSPVSYPIFLQTKKKVENGGFHEMVLSWKTSLYEWRKNFTGNHQFREFSEQDYLSFEVVLFSDMHKTPLLTIKDAYIKGDKIKLS
ncbi:hypothetical protein [Enterococcus sp. DIV0800]|uniref:hypothetical protein n=1 Tax=unclassified Enterococcus TaxID=2608891 RepID=UPI003D2FEC36